MAVPYAVFTLVALMGLGLFLWAGRRGTGGPLVFPLDDAYIHLQYARQLADGHFLQYNTGDVPSTGATSLLFIFLLAPLFWIIKSTDGIVLIEFGLGAFCLLLSAVGVYRLSKLGSKHLLDGFKAWQGEAIGILSGLLLLLNGAFLWVGFSGMETLLFVALTIWAYDAFLNRRRNRLLVISLLLVLTRPEGLLLAFIFPATDWALARTRREVAGQAPWRYVVPVVLGLSTYLVNTLLTGRPSPNGLVAKSWLYSAPFTWDSLLTSVFQYFWEMLAIHLNGGSSQGVALAPPLMAILALYAGFVLLRQPEWLPKAMAISLGAWIVLGSLMVSTLSNAFWHYGRYELPMVAATILLGVLGFGPLLNRFLGRTEAVAWAKFAAGGVVAAALLWSTGVGLHQALTQYSLSTRTFFLQQFAQANWVSANVPAGASVAIADAGGVAFFGGRRTIDMIGLTTNAMTIANRNGPGSSYEALERMRPDFFASYENVPAVMAYLTSTSVVGAAAYAAGLTAYSPYSSAGSHQFVSPADWRLANSGSVSYQPDVLDLERHLTLADSLDVADLESEKMHWYTVGQKGLDGSASEVHQFGYRIDPEIQVIDGGRAVTDYEEMLVNTVSNQDLLIVSRVNAAVPGEVDVSVDGQYVGRWSYPAIPGEWQEVSFWVPASLISTERSKILFEPKPSSGSEALHEPYYYWFYQGYRDLVPELEFARNVRVQFGDVGSVVGYELDKAAHSAGQSVGLTLYWEAINGASTPLTVFAHVLDAQGNLITGYDHEPYFGVKPVTHWRRGDVVVDPYSIPLPQSIASGEYSLEVGLYSLETGERVPAIVDGREAGDSYRLFQLSVNK